METVDVLMKMPKIEGYEYTGEWRVPEEGEHYAGLDAQPVQASTGAYLKRPILRKAEVWKPLTLEKAIEVYQSRNSITWRLTGGDKPGAARSCAITGIYVSALGQQCVAFPDNDDTLGIRHTIHRVEYLED